MHLERPLARAVDTADADATLALLQLHERALSASLHRLLQARPQLCLVITESNLSLLKDIPTETLVLERGELQRSAAAAAAVH